ncbi:MAG: hypothetical protein WAV47_01155 [Blastocatellia bacterium]
MQILEQDESWPYTEQFTRARAADQEERMGRLHLLHSTLLHLEEMAKDYTRRTWTSRVSTLPPQPRGVAARFSHLIPMLSPVRRTNLTDRRQ